MREAAPEAEEAIKWAQPVYSHNGPFCYIKAFAHHINIGFWRGKELDDPAGVLASGGDRMAHIKITAAGDVRPEVIRPLIVQAVQLNAAHGDPARRKSAR